MSLLAESGKKLPLNSGEGKKLPLSGVWGAMDPGSGGISPIFLFCFLLALLAASYPGVFLGLESLFYRDFGAFGAPLAAFHRQAFWQGELPLWNPLNNCGLPFAAQWNAMVFYPFSLVYLLLPFPWSLNLFCLGHAAWGGVTMFWLARWWIGRTNSLGPTVAGLAFAWNGLSLHALMWPNNIAALAWMPLVVLQVQQGARHGSGRLFGAALIGAVQMVTGAPEIIGFTWVIALVLLMTGKVRVSDEREGQSGTLSGRPWSLLGGRFCVIFALVLALSAIQLLPFLELLSLSQRNHHFGGDAWSLPAWGVANFFVPLFRSTPSRLGVYSQDEQQWTSSYYVGIGVMLLALVALFNQRDRGTRLLGCLLLGAVWLAFGPAGFLHHWVTEIFPVLGFVRFPVKFVVIAVFVLALLAGQGADWVLNQSKEVVQRVIPRAVFGVTTLCGLILAVAFFYPFPQDSWSTTWKSGVSRLAFAILPGIGLLLKARTTKANAKVLTTWGILLCLGLDVLTHAPLQNPIVPASSFSSDHQNVLETGTPFSRTLLNPNFKTFLSYASTDSPLENWKGFRNGQHANCNLLEGIAKTDGFYSLYLKDEALLRERLEHVGNVSALPILDFLSVEKTSHPAVPFKWQQRKGFHPLVTAGQQPIFTNETGALELAASPTFKPSQEVYLPFPTRAEETIASAGRVEIRDVKIQREKLMFDTVSEKPAWAVIAQAHYPAWHAVIDGKPVKLWKANVAFQALEVPAGSHHVEVVYTDDKLLWGAMISMAALGLCISGAAVAKFHSPRTTHS